MQSIQTIIIIAGILLFQAVSENTYAQTNVQRDTVGFFNSNIKKATKEEDDDVPIDSAPGFGDDVPDTIPVDGGLSLLVVAGVGYGVKKLRDKKQNT